jgi:hypothetical protein
MIKKNNEDKFINNNNELNNITITTPRIIADEEKTINRMIRGRVEKEIK